MLRNYWITALRNLWRSKGSTTINVLGLALGVATSLVLFLIVRYHSGFDTYHSKRDRIYRVVFQSEGNQGKGYSTGVPPALPDAFRTDFPEAEHVIFTSYRAGGLITIPQSQGEPKRFSEDKGIVYLQPEYFKIFDRSVLAGDAAKGLDEPNEAMLSQSSALKYFGKTDVLGEVIVFDNQEFKVTAVVDDVPTATDFPFNILLSYATIKKQKDEVGWSGIWSDEHCYFLKKEEASISEMERRLPDFFKKHQGEENPDNLAYILQPLSTIHYDERFNNYNYNTVTWQMIAAFTVIALFLILTACINFINLVTAEAVKRSKEVGIRKTLGSSRSQLIFQFLGESTLVTLVAVLLAVGLAHTSLIYLNPFLHLTLRIDLLNDGQLWIFLLLVTLTVAFLAGLYPALVVSGFKPVFAIKNQMNNKNSSGFLLRRSLVVLQFFISQFFIFGTIVLISQMNYFQKRDLGFRKDAIVTLPIPENARFGFADGSSKMRTLREQVSQVPGIELASLSNTPPSSGSVSSTNFGLAGKEEQFDTQIKNIDGNYLDLYDLTLLAGRNVSDLDTANGFIVNEKLANMVGFANATDIVGSQIELGGARGRGLPVIGVVKNFHTMSLHEPVDATIMYNRIRNYATMSLQVNQAEFPETIKHVQTLWEQMYPEHIFSYQFLAEEVREFYEGEKRMATLLSIFTSIAIFIGCLGLFGLAAFMVNQKTKEIGVRKVLGASVESILLSFSKEYVKLILIGFALAAPLGWYVMSKWLEDFAYKIEIGPMIFLPCLGITLVIALVTVGYRSFKAAHANPAQSLRSE
jgi:predicted permease